MRNLAAPAWLFAVGLLAVSPTALVAQNDTGQPVGQEDNTSYGTTSAEFLLLGAGARGRGAGRQLRRHRHRHQLALLQPRRGGPDREGGPHAGDL